MGALLNRRRYMGGKALPYDAEIEYIASDGTAYIEIEVNIPAGSHVAFGGEIRPYSSSGRARVLQSYPNADRMSIYKYGNSGNTMIYHTYIGNTGDGGSYLRIPIDEISTFEVSTEGVTVNGTFYSMARTLDKIVSYIRLPVSKMTGYGNFYVKINGVKIVDCIPVRKGQVGYYYDTISKKMLPSETGEAFTLGPDKT